LRQLLRASVMPERSLTKRRTTFQCQTAFDAHRAWWVLHRLMERHLLHRVQGGGGAT
jgi:hypothetical protein